MTLCWLLGLAAVAVSASTDTEATSAAQIEVFVKQFTPRFR